ncbi:MAG TPA: Gfo/Idh/MocA family oxidoreductase [Phycisphaerae bacterium]|jgi:predicted dehydrogenase|nr:Gfo/Idh/MocA family oxidoreductase [Phycisphaerae bacterium]HOJ52998.1 Gfo/Idh/MocA family oxidoreductase [Phycisphaerae bacterium]HOL24735.1 Gfo/Idh/MocA family oxidoreductase [Phycisphaerae bacterium]HPP19271.1 Gfo/Idh/MocA family oxidoreductase [Phycisphaerae bacterium]HPU31342.1 Gfo/Idh/MocA family oxidoreductase [Phycisphaerae bacterium]
MRNQINRRNLLQLAGAGLATAAVARPARADASGRIRCALLGAGGRGTSFLPVLAGFQDVDITAICDVKEAHLTRAQGIVEKAGRPRPVGFGEKGPDDYKRMLESKDLDAVIIATPMQDHARMSIDALNAGKAVLSEVAAAMTMDECWGLVRAVERTGKLYMLAENVCYYRDVLAILNMVKAGLFGGLTYAECGYVHDCRFIDFNPDGSLTWRGELARDHIGNLYPTHPIGPVAQWMDINRSDRFVSLVSMTSRSTGMARWAAKKFGPDSPQAKATYKKGDTTSTLIQTAKGAVIHLRYDTASPHPLHTTTPFQLQGDAGAYNSSTNEIWFESRSEWERWEPFSKYAAEFDHPLWKKWEKEASRTSHGGADFFVLREFFDALRSGGKSPIDVYDAVTWSCIIPLSAESIRKGNAPVAIPDFKRKA